MITTAEEVLMKVLKDGYPLLFEKNEFFCVMPALIKAGVIVPTQQLYINGMIILELHPIPRHVIGITDDNHSLPMPILAMNRRNNYTEDGLFQLNISGSFFDTIEYIRNNVPTPFNGNIQPKRVIPSDQI